MYSASIDARTNDDARVTAARHALDSAPQDQRPRHREHFARLRSAVRTEKHAELAREFDAVHSVAR